MRHLFWGALLLVSVLATTAQLCNPMNPIHRAGTARTSHPDLLPLVTIPLASIVAVEIQRGEAAHRFDRGADGRWPTPEVEATVATFSRARIERIVDASGERPDAYGLDSPHLGITLWHRGGSIRYAAGDLAPDTLSRYVQRRPNGPIVTIPDYQIGAWLAILP